LNDFASNVLHIRRMKFLELDSSKTSRLLNVFESPSIRERRVSIYGGLGDMWLAIINGMCHNINGETLYTVLQGAHDLIIYSALI